MIDAKLRTRESEINRNRESADKIGIRSQAQDDP